MLYLLKKVIIWSVKLSILLLVLVFGVVFISNFASSKREVHERGDAAPTTGQYVTAGGLDIFIQEMGPKNGKPVLFIHGTGAWSETWRKQMTALAESGYRAIALDLPPFGYSQRPNDSTYGRVEQGQRIIGVLDALGISQAVLVGHSFGGGATVEAAMMYPQRVSKLILIDAALGLNFVGSEQPLALKVLDYNQSVKHAFVAATLTNPQFTKRILTNFIHKKDSATGDIVRIYQEPLTVKNTSMEVGNWLSTLFTVKSEWESSQKINYSSIQKPVLVVWGDSDTITPLAQGEELAKLIPGARLEIMSGVGHIPQIEDPDSLNKIILTFLNQ